MDVKFKKFSDVENSYHEKFFSKVKGLGDTGNWVALEKVHGSNFSFIVSPNSLRVAKRTSILEEGTNFNGINYEKLIEKYREPCQKLFSILMSENCQQITIFGEIFGGIYEGLPTKDTNHVQKGVYYFNEIEFYAFDIWNGKQYLNYDECMKLFEECNFFYAKPIFTGTLEEVLKISNTFESTIPELLGMPKLENNIAEGLVLKPIKSFYLPSGKRVILKSKTPQFSEVKKKPPQEKKDLSNVDVTQNRLDNVKSHGVEGNCLGLLVKDILKEFERDEDDLRELYQNLKKNEMKVLKKRLGVACKKLLD